MEQITISDGKRTSAVILPEKGATVISLTYDGAEFLFRDDENLMSSERPRCGIPFLFPIFGRLQNGCYQYDGRSYAMQIHGFAHTSVWQVVSCGEDNLVLSLESDEQIRKQYPFLFRVTLTYRVTEGCLSIAQRYENLDEKPIPFNYGFHPYFWVEDLAHAYLEATAAIRVDFTQGMVPFGHGNVQLTVPEGAPEAGTALAQIQSPAVLWLPDEGRKITLEFDDSFTQLALWTRANTPFLCVEPINGTPNGLNTGVFFTLAPGEIREAVVRFGPEMISK